MYRSTTLFRLTATIFILVVVQSSVLFRRNRQAVHRSDAYREMFEALETLFAATAQLRPDWNVQWQERRQQELPPKYEGADELITNATHDMRYATMLLRRYRWKSVVQPLFDDVDEVAFSRFSTIASDVSPALLRLIDRHIERLREDEVDWVNVAVEQFDEATRRRRRAVGSEIARSELVADGVYQPVYIAIQLSDRLIERLRYDAEQR